MRIDKLRLKNFRCFSEVELDLDEDLTVLVAENGQGKSAVLDAIRIGLWPFVSCFDIAKNAKADSGNGIAIGDVRLIKMTHGDMARQLPAEVAIAGDYGNDKSTTWVRYRDKEAKSTQTKGTKAQPNSLKSGLLHCRPKAEMKSKPHRLNCLCLAITERAGFGNRKNSPKRQKERTIPKRMTSTSALSLT
ncbi:hypothetical protein HAALTHF_10310n [Vreelandella aquamarina]|nr:hypothetical protein HAALTHF_10310n [Halomonas axialensis]